MASITFVTATTSGSPNTLTDAERDSGWRLLFDGKTTSGWQGARGRPFPSKSWIIREASIETVADGQDGDLWTTERYSNFELELDYRIFAGGNSGVKYLVQPEWLSPLFQPDLPEPQKRRYALEAVGPEFQIIDDAAMKHDARWELSSSGALYLLYVPRDKQLRPPGEWNHIRISVSEMHVEHWLNGRKLLEYELGSNELFEKVDQTKFRKVPGFGRKGPGYIVLQHHNSPVCFRNIKIRTLP